jgi:hypothetical protein
MPDEEFPDLSLVPSDALVTELAKRYDHLLICREKIPNESHAEVLFEFSGGLSAALGLAVRAQQYLLNVATPEKDEKEDEPDDE